MEQYAKTDDVESMGDTRYKCQGISVCERAKGWLENLMNEKNRKPQKKENVPSTMKQIFFVFVQVCL